VRDEDVRLSAYDRENIHNIAQTSREHSARNTSIDPIVVRLHFVDPDTGQRTTSGTSIRDSS
jgi:hypothetical protein